MFALEIFEGEPFREGLEMAVETKGKEEACMAIAQVVAGFIVDNPGRVDTLGLGRDG